MVLRFRIKSFFSESQLIPDGFSERPLDSVAADDNDLPPRPSDSIYATSLKQTMTSKWEGETTSSSVYNDGQLILSDGDDLARVKEERIEVRWLWNVDDADVDNPMIIERATAAAASGLPPVVDSQRSSRIQMIFRVLNIKAGCNCSLLLSTRFRGESRGAVKGLDKLRRRKRQLRV